MSRIIPGTFNGNGKAAGARPRDQVTLVDALDELTADQRRTITGLIMEFAGAMRKPKKGANHRTRNLLAFLTSASVLDWFSVAQLHQLAGAAAVAAYVREHQDAPHQEKGGA